MSLKTIADVIREQFEVPEGYTQLYVRSIEPGKANQYGFEWPRTPGATLTTDKANIRTNNSTGCPRCTGDGFCLATTYRGMESGVFSARTLLVVAVRDDDILGTELGGQKIRVRHALVVACVNGSKLVRRFGKGMDLFKANLRGANLRGVKLNRAKLDLAYLLTADLGYADLSEADLRGAYLLGANLYGANLGDADLSGADLSWANLGGADLCGADLHEANLRFADLSGACLRDVNLCDAYLHVADLSGVDLHGADLHGAEISI